MTRNLTEEDNITRLIDPKLAEAGWNPKQIWREHYFTDGRKLTGNKLGKGLNAVNLPRVCVNNLALTEAK